ncbi:restriction endonuclease [Mycobacterium sp.]|uniref:restriction endonuclease n=1 Tax=Mycobacterium sp. TaxID=1785 RepID=UPI003F99CB6A
MEGKQKLPAESGTEWEVDARGVKADDGATVVIECRQHGDKLRQKDMAALAYVISDVGAAAGIIVTPIGLQEGAEKVAGHEGIQLVHLAANSTTTDFVIEFLEKVIHGASAHLGSTATFTATAEVVRADDSESPR